MEVEDPDARMGSFISVDENPFGMQFGQLLDNRSHFHVAFLESHPSTISKEDTLTT